ncbi:FeoA family protein [Pontixanthobacter aquaemixtae]|uniref:Ferrous iron transport protein A n=1 Tax=Pontixanthobacter aquaemixtae TaxID=1958940 RepID=A0A844ZP49_9SPHN|nr:FeoA family protein [Pontixanthobacter aquaemixtae]MXO89334.1 ferrous iron transport protein A [Pontixanthobacter aquaemixtae]
MDSRTPTLDSLKPGVHATIISVDWDALASEEGKRLRALGIDEGAHVGIAHKGVFGGSDPIAITIGRMTIAVRKVHAAAMQVDPA